jgi:hypothetical protein
MFLHGLGFFKNELILKFNFLFGLSLHYKKVVNFNI